MAGHVACLARDPPRVKTPMNTRFLIVPLALFSLTPASAQGSVLCIVADDLGVDRVGAYGGTGLGMHPNPGRTPNIDRLAADGVLFRNAWSSPVCSVARAAMLSGRFGFRTGVGDNVVRTQTGHALHPDEWFLPELIRSGTAGSYTSIGIGKWHLATSDDQSLHPLSCGFDSFLGNSRGFGQGGYTDWRKMVNGKMERCTKYATTDSVDDAIRAFEETPERLFLWLAFNAPHTPFHQPPEGLHSFELKGEPSETPVDHMKAMVEAMDREIGRLLASLSEARREELTIIFIGDNGTAKEATDAPFPVDHAKGTIYQGGVHVPLIISGPAVKSPGRESDALVLALDLYSTIAELSGVDPAKHLPVDWVLDSKSLGPLLSDPEAKTHRDWLYAEKFYPYGTRLTKSLTYQIALRDERFKLIRIKAVAVEPSKDSFYDLRLDPFEQSDLLLVEPEPNPDAPTDAKSATREHYERLRTILDDLIPKKKQRKKKGSPK